MQEPAIKLDAIRIQTARMMEIYALLKNELEKNTLLMPSEETRAQLDSAIETIRANMGQLLNTLITYQEQLDSTDENESAEAGEPNITHAFSDWHTANARNDFPVTPRMQSLRLAVNFSHLRVPDRSLADAIGNVARTHRSAACRSAKPCRLLAGIERVRANNDKIRIVGAVSHRLRFIV